MAIRRQAFRQRALSMTSLIDVIFLLLLFFMLSSTFTRFAEIELNAGGSGAPAASANTPPLFLQMTDDGLSLTGSPVTLDDLPGKLAELKKEENTRLLIAPAGQNVTSQLLIDLLVSVRRTEGLSVTVLE